MEDPDSSLCSSMESCCATLARWYLSAPQYSQRIHPFYWPDKNRISSSPLLLCNVTSDIQKGQSLWHNRMTLLSSFAPHGPPTTLNIGKQLIMEITRMFKIPGLDRSFFPLWVWIKESIRRLKCEKKLKKSWIEHKGLFARCERINSIAPLRLCHPTLKSFPFSQARLGANHRCCTRP